MKASRKDSQHDFEEIVREVEDEWLNSLSLKLPRSEVEIPSVVKKTMEYLWSRDVWFRVSRNAQPPSRKDDSCAGAARRRWRLGHKGIPLWDELKSRIARFTNAAGEAKHVIAHCRGDREINFERLRRTLRAKSEPTPLEADDMDALGLEYGLVNPFETWEPRTKEKTFFQVFDAELEDPIGFPGTVMTNAGDRTWAIEFNVKQLVDRSDHAVFEDIHKISEKSRREKMKRNPSVATQPIWGVRGRCSIGIITGNAPEAGIGLWQGLNRHVRSLLGIANCGDVSMPNVEIQSLPVLGLTMELKHRETDVWKELKKVVQDMCKRGIQYLSVACHTTHYFTPQIRTICDAYGVEFVSMAETLSQWLTANDISEFALASIGFVAGQEQDDDGSMRFGRWSPYRGLFDTEPFKVELPNDALQSEIVNALLPDSPLHSEPLEVEVPESALQLELHELSYLIKEEGPDERGRPKSKVVNEFVLPQLNDLLNPCARVFYSQRRTKPCRNDAI